MIFTMIPETDVCLWVSKKNLVWKEAFFGKILLSTVVGLELTNIFLEVWIA